MCTDTLQFLNWGKSHHKFDIHICNDSLLFFSSFCLFYFLLFISFLCIYFLFFWKQYWNSTISCRSFYSSLLFFVCVLLFFLCTICSFLFSHGISRKTMHKYTLAEKMLFVCVVWKLLARIPHWETRWEIKSEKRALSTKDVCVCAGEERKKCWECFYMLDYVWSWMEKDFKIHWM